MNLHIQTLLALEAVVGEISGSSSKVAKEALRVLNEEHPAVADLLTEHGRLCRAHRQAAPPYTLDLPKFLACVEALDLTSRDLTDGFRPCIASAGLGGPRYCYKKPGGGLHMGPFVSSF